MSNKKRFAGALEEKEKACSGPCPICFFRGGKKMKKTAIGGGFKKKQTYWAKKSKIQRLVYHY